MKEHSNMYDMICFGVVVAIIVVISIIDLFSINTRRKYERALEQHEKALFKDSLFEKIKHGDQAHQDWLKKEIDNHFLELK